MANLPIEEIEKRVGSRYALTVLAGKRARELRDGAPRLVNTDSSNPILIALQEIHEGKVVPENLDLSAAEAPPTPQEVAAAEREVARAIMSGTVEPSAETAEADGPSPLAGVDLADLTGADNAGIELHGAVDITGQHINESTPEVAGDRLDADLEIGADAVATLEDTDDATSADVQAIVGEDTPAAEALAGSDLSDEADGEAADGEAEATESTPAEDTSEE